MHLFWLFNHSSSWGNHSSCCHLYLLLHFGSVFSIGRMFCMVSHMKYGYMNVYMFHIVQVYLTFICMYVYGCTCTNTYINTCTSLLLLHGSECIIVTQEAAIAPLPLTIHLESWAESYIHVHTNPDHLQYICMPFSLYCHCTHIFISQKVLHKMTLMIFRVNIPTTHELDSHTHHHTVIIKQL